MCSSATSCSSSCCWARSIEQFDFELKLCGSYHKPQWYFDSSPTLRSFLAEFHASSALLFPSCTASFSFQARSPAPKKRDDRKPVRECASFKTFIMTAAASTRLSSLHVTRIQHQYVTRDRRLCLLQGATHVRRVSQEASKNEPERFEKRKREKRGSMIAQTRVAGTDARMIRGFGPGPDRNPDPSIKIIKRPGGLIRNPI